MVFDDCISEGEYLSWRNFYQVAPSSKFSHLVKQLLKSLVSIVLSLMWPLDSSSVSCITAYSCHPSCVIGLQFCDLCGL